MTVIDDIKPDELCEMTTVMDRAFRAVDCVPECHCCHEPILILQKFKLAYIKRPTKTWISESDSKDEMLCEKCTPAKLLRAEKARKKKLLAAASLSRGFSRKHKP